MRTYTLETTVAPPAEPVTLAELKAHLRIDVTDHDDQLNALLTAARIWAENQTRRSFVQRTFELRMDNWCVPILLPRGPVSAVSSIVYIAAGGTETTLAADQYQADLKRVPARIVPAYGVVWPTVKNGEINAVRVTYVAGDAPGETSPTDYAENVSALAKAAIKLYVEALFDRDMQMMDRLIETAARVLVPLELRDYRLE